MLKNKSLALRELEDTGYTVVNSLLDVEKDIQPVINEYQQLLNGLEKSLDIENLTANESGDLSFGEHLTLMMQVTDGSIYQNLEISLPQNNITTETPMHHGPAVFQLLTNPKLLDIVEELIGPEIYSNPVQHVRIKPPQKLLPSNQQQNTLVSQAIWHQDQGTVRKEADKTMMITVWIPIVDATEENGCLVVAPGSHKRGLSLHCEMPSGIHEIPDGLVGPSRKTLPMNAGDVLFMNKLTMHASLPNTSDGIRWSFDLRYNPIGDDTGRPWFPGFVARSRSNPNSELRNAKLWAESWREARDNLANMEAPMFQRWNPNDPLCA